MTNYEEIRPQIQSGDILAWSHKGWKSFYDVQIQLVRMATRSEYSHIGVAWVVAGRVFVIEAVVPQVRIYPLSKEVPFYWIPCGKYYWNDEVEEYALNKVGDEYSKIQAIMAFFNKIRTGEDSLWQCSELANKVLTVGGLLKTDEAVSTPTAVVEVLQNKGYPTYLVTE